MDIRAVVFDVNGTLVDIHTEDGADDVFRAASRYLTYQGIGLPRRELRDLYFATMKAQRATSPERHPEFDAVEIWRGIVERYASPFTHRLPTAKIEQLPLALAELTRGIARHRLRRYPHVRAVLRLLRERFPLAVVTDAQSAWARAELHQVGLLEFFDPIVVSGDHGFRKPDPRLFLLALDALGIRPDQAVYVGNDMHRDVYGAHEVGMVTVMFDSDQGVKRYRDVVPDFTITDHLALLPILGLPAPLPQPGAAAGPPATAPPATTRQSRTTWPGYPTTQPPCRR